MCFRWQCRRRRCCTTAPPRSTLASYVMAALFQVPWCWRILVDRAPPPPPPLPPPPVPVPVPVPPPNNNKVKTQIPRTLNMFPKLRQYVIPQSPISSPCHSCLLLLINQLQVLERLRKNRDMLFNEVCPLPLPHFSFFL